MKQLIIAEKPSVARDIAKYVGAHTRMQGYLQGPEFDVTWCIGHLVQLAMPDAYGWETWDVSSLPMIPQDYQLIANPKTQEQFDVVKTLLHGQYDAVINACDAGREGEHIFRLVYTLAQSKLPIKRLWIASLTEEAIRHGMNALELGSSFDALADAARARSHADWLVGMNATRAVSLALRKHNPGIKTPVLSIGRVQTPTLALLVKRHKDITAFIPKTYFECHAQFSKDGEVFTGKFIDRSGDVVRIDKQAIVQSLIERLQGHPGHIIKCETKQTRRTPPMFFDLTSLQRQANSTLGFSAQKTLDVAQSLYERHKVLSYPRTDSKHITEDLAQSLPGRIMTIAQSFEEAMDLTFDVNALPKRLVDPTKVSDHHAILVTEEIPGEDLTEDERAIYEMVARRCMAALSTPAITSTTTVYTQVGQGCFISKGSQLVDEGFLAFEPAKQSKDQLPATLAKDQMWHVDEIKSIQCKTRPPKRLTEASLLLAMETAGKSLDDDSLQQAIAGHGLGTSATRASIIETLIARQYIERDNKALIPTEMGVQLIDALDGFEALTSAQLTARWEFGLEKMARGALEYDAFMAGIKKYIHMIVGHFKARGVSIKVDGPQMAKPLGVCPNCKGQVMLYEKLAGCTSCDFKLWRTVAQKTLEEKDLLALLTKKRTGPIAGFFSTKKNKPFTGALVLICEDQTWSVGFEFGGPQ